MTIEELDEKLQIGPEPQGTDGDSWFATGKADGVIFRTAKRSFVTKNGVLVDMTDKAEDARIEKRALRYLRPSTLEERTTPFGFVHRFGWCQHMGGLVDRLTPHYKVLRDEIEKGVGLKHFCSMNAVGKGMMSNEIFPFLKVLCVEDGIFVIVFDPEDLIPK